jgi:hypothetical protein
MSTFVISASTSTFTADQDGFSESYDQQTGLRNWSFTALLPTSTDYTTLFGLRSWQVSRYAAPGGSGVFADVGGGSGKGTLTLDNVVGSPFGAVLYSISRPSAYPGGQRKATCTFWEVP